MKKVLMAAVTVLTVIVMTAVYAGAAGTLSSTGIAVTAAISKNCIESQAGTLPQFTNIDTSSSVPVTVSATPATDEVIKCTNGVTPVTITATSGNSATNTGACNSTGVQMQMKSPTATAGTDVIPYYFKCSNGSTYTGKGFGSSGGLALGIQATVVPSDAQTASYATDYKDTVTLTISY